MLVMFPIAFFTGALVVDMIAFFSGRHALHAMGYYLCVGGAVMAVVAAVPGFIDYVMVVPPASSAKSRATRHALLNGASLAIFVTVIVVRRAEFSWYILCLEVLAVGLMVVGGWLGGTLVHRNQIGIDHRYASAGKWKEQRFSKPVFPLAVASAGELKEDQMKLLHIDGKRIVLAKTGKGYAAFDDRCRHRGGSLADGVLMCGTVHCPWHGSQYDVQSGACVKGPATEGLTVYPVEEQGGKVVLLRV